MVPRSGSGWPPLWLAHHPPQALTPGGVVTLGPEPRVGTTRLPRQMRCG